jgi:hypothetical protein
VGEGAITLDQGVEHLQQRGVVARTIESVARALGLISPSSSPSSSDNPPAADPAHRARRL